MTAAQVKVAIEVHLSLPSKPPSSADPDHIHLVTMAILRMYYATSKGAYCDYASFSHVSLQQRRRTIADIHCQNDMTTRSRKIFHSVIGAAPPPPRDAPRADENENIRGNSSKSYLTSLHPINDRLQRTVIIAPLLSSIGTTLLDIDTQSMLWYS